MTCTYKLGEQLYHPTIGKCYFIQYDNVTSLGMIEYVNKHGVSITTNVAIHTLSIK